MHGNSEKPFSKNIVKLLGNLNNYVTEPKNIDYAHVEGNLFKSLENLELSQMIIPKDSEVIFYKR